MADLIRRVTLPTSVEHLAIVSVLNTKFGSGWLKMALFIGLYYPASRRF